jgi:hypothetical protein
MSSKYPPAEPGVWVCEPLETTPVVIGIEGGVVSEVISLESPGVEAPSRRPRHDRHYHEVRFLAA